MPKFIVLNTAILHDGKRYDIGSEIELTEEQAQNNALNLKTVAEESAPQKSEPQKPEATETAVTEADVQAAEANVEKVEAAKKGKK